jgi:thiol-disulfide isomerase/thioredoxin
VTRRLAILALALASCAFAVMPVPRPSKEFTFVEPSGRQTLLSSYKGKVVVIQFLSTTCPHCQALSKVLNKLSGEFGNSVQFIGVAFNEATPAMADQYAKMEAIRIPVAYAPHETVLSFLGYSVMDRLTVPQMVIVDKKGVIRAQSVPLGTEELSSEAYLRKFVGDLVKEGAGASAAKAK